MSLLRRHGIVKSAGGGFHPNDLNPVYFNESQTVFTGSNAVDTSIYSADFNLDYFHIYVKISLDDGNPTGLQSLIGSRDVSSSTRNFIYINTDGSVRATVGATSFNLSNGPLFSDGAQSATTIHLQKGNFALYQDGSLVYDGNATPSWTSQTNYTTYYGAQNRIGIIQDYLTATGYGLFIWAGASDLTAQNILDLDTYFNNL